MNTSLYYPVGDNTSLYYPVGDNTVIITFFSAGIGLYSKFSVKEMHFCFHVDSGVYRVCFWSQLASVGVGTVFDKTPGGVYDFFQPCVTD